MAQVPLYLLLGGVKAVAPAAGDAAGAEALASFATAMEQLQRAMLVRFVWRTNSDPVLGVCIPSAKATRSILYFSTLPFAEVLRHYRFPSLQEVSTSADQIKAVGDLVNAMTMPADELRPKEVFNPALQQHYNCVRHRFLHPDQPLPAIPAQVKQSSCCWGESGNVLAPLFASAQPLLARVGALFPFEQKQQGIATAKPFWFTGGAADDALQGVSPSAAAGSGAASPANFYGGTASSATPQSESSSLKTAMDIAHRPVDAVTTVDPVGTFEALIARRGSVDAVERAMFQMTEVVMVLLRSSLGAQFYKRCDACIDALRIACIREGEPGTFNRFLVNLQVSLRGEAHDRFWTENVIHRGVLPITKLECAESDIPDAVAAQLFLSQDRKTPAPLVEAVAEEDLFEQLE